MLLGCIAAYCCASPIDSLLFSTGSLAIEKCDSCTTIGLNARKKIMEYYHQGRMDSINSVYKCWVSLCGVKKVDYRFKIIQSIISGTFDENKIDGIYFDETEWYQNFPRRWNKYNSDYYYRNEKNNDDFSGFVTQFSNKILPGLDTTSSAFLYVLYYGRNFERFFSEIKKDTFKKTHIADLYRKEIRRTKLFPGPRIGFAGGLWHPYGNLTLIGNKPEGGLFVGIRWLRFSLDFMGFMRPLPSDNEYIINNNEKLDTTTTHAVTHLGLDFMVHALKIGRHEIDLIGGVGWENVETDNKPLSAIPVIPGIGYRFYFGENEQMYIGAQVRYYSLKFNNAGGTPLDGHALSLRLFYGFSDYCFRNSKLKALRAMNGF
jgi:hypothetical protein